GKRKIHLKIFVDERGRTSAKQLIGIEIAFQALVFKKYRKITVCCVRKRKDIAIGREISGNAIYDNIGHKNPSANKIVLRGQHKFRAYAAFLFWNEWISGFNARKIEICAGINGNRRNQIGPLCSVVGFPTVQIWAFHFALSVGVVN